MRTSMVYPIRFWALILAALLLYQFSAEAVAGSCKLEKTGVSTAPGKHAEINVYLPKGSSGGIKSRDVMGEIDILKKV